MLFGSKTGPIGPDNALPGRDDPMPISGIHAVLGTSMVPPFPDDTETLVVAMGCYWGAERIYWQQRGVHTTAVGFAAGWTPNPTYRESCTGRTGSTEAVLVVYRPADVSMETLLKLFWENHDPTQLNRQGNDVGTQYRSGIYWTTDEQRAAILASREQYQQALTDAGYGEIVTELLPLAEAGDGQFYYAEEEHQQYLHKNPWGYCNHGFCQVSYDA
ncbi:MAG: peptide-methionine (S)-S-oxide reductase MsrA [Nitriliruptorales bacterium]|nr:peptide-methionine (S)-S-oxide reductase MsrA [Nitriliruptorales bacterium]